MLTVLGGLAEFERSLILARTSDGRTRAKDRGVRFGRPPSLTAHHVRKRSSGLLRAKRRRILLGVRPRHCLFVEPHVGEILIEIVARADLPALHVRA